MSVTITVDDAAVQQMFSRVRAVTSDMTRTMDRIGVAMAARISSTIESQADPYGMPFRSLAPATLRRRGAGAKALQDRGILKNSIQHHASRDGVEIFSKVEYAAAQQFGHPRWRNRQGRAFFPFRGAAVVLPDAWRDEVMDLIAIDINGAMQ